ncbi:Calx-beta domain-containing protein, partial [Microvirga lupini]
WLFKGAGTDAWDISSSESSSVTSRPVLSVTYTTGSSEPVRPVVSITPGTPNPQIEGQGAQISFTITLDKPSSQPVTVTYSTENGTALAGSDFTGVSGGSVTFAPNETSKTVTINLINDSTPEPAESFSVKIDTATNATVSSTSNTATGNIADNDTAPTTVTFRDGLGGYAGTIDTMIRQNAPGAGAGAATTLRVDADANAEYQTLLAFTNLFGTGPGQIPPGAIITSASLTLRTTNDSLQGGTLHRMNTSWDENATWTSLGNGVQIGSEADLAADVSTGRTVNGSRSFDVTESLRAWAAGEDNYGWLFKGAGTDAWDISSSESSSVTSRPVLSVTYTMPQNTSSLAETARVATSSQGDTALVPDGGETYTGGLGDDVFIFSQGNGHDTIVNFVAGEALEDRIDLRGIGAEFSFEQLQDLFRQDGGDTVIDFGNGDVLRLSGVQASKLVASDFLL